MTTHRHMRLRKARNKAGLTQEQLAGLSGVKQSTISKIESRHLLKPSFDTLYRLSWALKKCGVLVEPTDIQPRKQPVLVKGVFSQRLNIGKRKRTA